LSADQETSLRIIEEESIKKRVERGRHDESNIAGYKYGGIQI
jgi:hypothetical protein